MNPDLWQRVRPVLRQLATAPKLRQKAELEALEKRDWECAREVRTLLAAEEEAKAAGFLEGIALPPPFLSGEPLAPGTRLGSYQIIKMIGQGGMGVVYQAEQLQPVRRTVALKLLREDLVFRGGNAYFDRERQFLARLEHNYIARVYDFGLDVQRRPFFVMELVSGESITEHSDREELSLNDRLNLFLKVCEGVLFIHQHGVIHRDLKPANILIQREGATAVPKIIDFGVSKAFSHDWASGFYTRGEIVAGTPIFMSPEQHGVHGQTVDIRTDVYALGMLLYQLLAGILPVESTELVGRTPREVISLIFGKAHQTPSQRLKGCKSAHESAGKRGFKQAAGLIRALKGDLDWIVAMATEPDPSRRYATVSDLMADIQRYLRLESVVAAPVSTFYLLRKMCRRNALLFSGIGLLFGGLFVGILGLWLGLLQAKAAQQQAQKEAHRANYTLSLIQDILGSASPAVQGREVKVVEVLETAGTVLDQESDRQADIQGAVYLTLADTFNAMTRPEKAEVFYARASELYQRHYGEDHPQTLQAARKALGNRNNMLITDQVEMAATLVTKHQEVHGKIHPATLEAEHLYSEVLFHGGQRQQGVALLEATLGTLRRQFPEESRQYWDAMATLATLYEYDFKFSRSAPLRQAIYDAQSQELGTQHPKTLNSLMELAGSYLRLERYREAEELFQQVWTAHQALYGPTNLNTLEARFGMASLAYELRDFDRVASILKEILPHYSNQLGQESRVVSRIRNLLAFALGGMEQHEQAELLHSRNLNQAKETLGENHPMTLYFMAAKAGCLANLKRWQEAENLFGKCYQAQKKSLGPLHTSTLRSLAGWARAQCANGSFEQAMQSYKELERTTGMAGKQASELTYTIALEQCECLVLQQDYATAETLLLPTYQLMKKKDQPDPVFFKRVKSALVQLYEKWEKPLKAEAIAADDAAL